ncbi:MAG: DUF4203 domain-containing protein [Desulfobacteraceae bacterium]|nr:DUF4203 domain-containing protein [Desulfobacteraceae bacterium]
MLIFNIIIGLILLLFGRKLFWLFIAFSGFMVGFGFSEMLIPLSQQWVQLVIAIGIGIVCALVGILVQRIAFVLAGCLAGLYLVLIGSQFVGYNDVSAVLYIFGGAIGGVAAYVFIDWAIIILSAMVGAGLVASVLGLSPTISIIAFMLMSIIGALIQIQSMDEMS